MVWVYECEGARDDLLEYINILVIELSWKSEAAITKVVLEHYLGSLSFAVVQRGVFEAFAFVIYVELIQEISLSDHADDLLHELGCLRLAIIEAWTPWSSLGCYF